LKKSKTVSLVLITAALASCNQQKEDEWGTSNGGSKTYVRGDSTAPYTRTHHNGTGIGTAFLWFYAFRPMYGTSNGRFGHQGYYSNAISQRSNFGTNSFKSNVFRGGFGRSSRVSSSRAGG
jgi:hypothetical protein